MRAGTERQGGSERSGPVRSLGREETRGYSASGAAGSGARGCGRPGQRADAYACYWRVVSPSPPARRASRAACACAVYRRSASAPCAAASSPGCARLPAAVALPRPPPLDASGPRALPRRRRALERARPRRHAPGCPHAPAGATGRPAPAGASGCRPPGWKAHTRAAAGLAPPPAAQPRSPRPSCQCREDPAPPRAAASGRALQRPPPAATRPATGRAPRRAAAGRRALQPALRRCRAQL